MVASPRLFFWQGVVEVVDVDITDDHRRELSCLTTILSFEQAKRNT